MNFFKTCCIYGAFTLTATAWSRYPLVQSCMANRNPEFEVELRADEATDDLVNYIVDNCGNSNLFAAYVDDESEITGSSAQRIECSVRCALPGCTEHYVCRCAHCWLMYCGHHICLCGDCEIAYCPRCAFRHRWCFVDNTWLAVLG